MKEEPIITRSFILIKFTEHGAEFFWGGNPAEETGKLRDSLNQFLGYGAAIPRDLAESPDFSDPSTLSEKDECCGITAD